MSNICHSVYAGSEISNFLYTSNSILVSNKTMLSACHSACAIKCCSPFASPKLYFVRNASTSKPPLLPFNMPWAKPSDPARGPDCGNMRNTYLPQVLLEMYSTVIREWRLWEGAGKKSMFSTLLVIQCCCCGHITCAKAPVHSSHVVKHAITCAGPFL